MHSRYHLCFAASSRKRPQAVPAHGSAVTGAPGARLLGMDTIPFGRRLRGVFAACLPPPFTGRGLSLRRVWRVLGLFIAVREVFYQRIPLLSTKIMPVSASGPHCTADVLYLSPRGTAKGFVTIIAKPVS